MPLPLEIDKRIRQRFEDLLKDSEKLLVDMARENEEIRARDRRNNVSFFGSYNLCEDSFSSLKTRVISLLEMLSSSSQHMQKLADEVRGLESKIAQAKVLKGIITGLKDDYESGMLEDLSHLIETNIAADYLGQAEQLLQEGQPGNFDHVPAAVLVGAILEDALRRLCQRQTPLIDTHKPDGSPKTLDPLITDLQKANVFNKAKADQLKSWAKTRNYAAHGEFTEFTRAEVEAMIVGIKNFLADYL